MKEKNAIAPILNDLITINKNRIVGYKEALHPNTMDNDRSTALFKQMIRQSEDYIRELEQSIKEAGAQKEDKTSTSGLLYNSWMDMLYGKNEDAEPDSKSFCIQIEETTLNAYRAVAAKTGEMHDAISELVANQKKGIEHSLDLVRAL